MKLWLVALVACGSAAKPPVPAASEPPSSPQSPLHPLIAQLNAFEPRPPIDLSTYPKPDLAADERWPLSMGSHPELEPHFDVAGALAQPGITWTDLCNRGIQNRHLSRDQDLVEYLKAWCTAAQHDVSAALYQLGKLRSSPVRGLRESLSIDAVDMLADHGSADDVENLLLRAGLLDLDIVDRLAASYLEAGRMSDAYAMNVLATHLDRQPSDANVCRRLTRAMAMGTADESNDAKLALRDLVAPPRQDKPPTSDSTCGRLWASVMCVVDDNCAPYWTNVAKLTPPQLKLMAIYHAWPDHPVDAERWFEIALDAERVPLDEAYRLALPALALTLRTSRCLPTELAEIGKVVDRLATRHHDPRFDASLNALTTARLDLDHAPFEHCQEHINALPWVEP